MKTSGTRILIIAILLYICLLIFSFSSFAVPDYNFSSGNHFGDLDKMIGRGDRFKKVRPGEDALVTISSASLKLVDYSGRIVHQETLNVQEGVNTRLLNNVSVPKPGNHIAVSEIDHSTHNQKILKK